MSDRTKNSAKNIKVGLIYKIVNLVVKFALRTVFIYSLGQAYVGINGVFSNILSVLSLTELGIGSAIVYDLYKPISTADEESITQLLNFYKKVYAIIGITILGIGFCICPFLNHIITGVPDVDNIQTIYILTLISTASSYFFAHYSSLMQAYQKQHIIDIYYMFGSLIKTCIEIILLIAFKSYILYLLFDIMINLTINFMIARKTIQLYPFIRNKVIELPLSRIKKIFCNALSVFSIRIASTIVNTTDNILISSMISTPVAGSYSTYLLVVVSVQQIVYTLKTGVMASVGNLCATSDFARKQRIFNILRFIYAWINCVVVTCFLVLLSPFIKLWAGNSYELPYYVVVVIVINYLLRGVQWSVEVFYHADGLYRHFRIKPWAEVVINIICSIVLCNYIGIVGIVLGTTISEIATTFWYDIFITNKYSLHGSLKEYWKSTIYYLLTIFVLSVLTVIITNQIRIDNPLIDIIVKFFIVSIFSVLGFMLPFIRTPELKYCLNYIKKLHDRIRKQ